MTVDGGFRARTCRLLVVAAVVVGSWSAVATLAAGGVGDVDDTFGLEGTYSDSVLRSSSEILVDSENRLYLPGFVSGAAAVRRLTPSGAVDTSYGTQGLSDEVLPGGGNPGRLYAIAQQADGKIVAAGIAEGRLDAAVVRFDTDGTLDTTYGDDGYVIFDVGGSGFDSAAAMELDDQGRAVVAGRASGSLMVARITTGGALDPSFGSAGVFELDITENFDEATLRDVIIDPDGSIVAVGTNDEATPSNADTVLVRLDTDGNLDESFSSDGLVVESTGGLGWAESIVRQTDGKYVIAGLDKVARFNSDGTLDGTFGSNGVATVAASDYLQLLDLVIDDLGAITVSGLNFTLSDENLLVARLRPDGSLDSSFATDGFLLTHPSMGRGEALAMQGDEYIVVLGWEANGFGTQVTRLVNGVTNSRPVAVDDGPFLVMQGGHVSGNVLVNDFDLESVPSAVIESDATHGHVTLDANGDFIYKADATFLGEDQFTYRASDGALTSDLATVSLSVVPRGTGAGLVDPTTGVWRLEMTTGIKTFYYGNPGDVPFMGDWDCDGIDTPGLFRQSDAYAYLRNDNSQGVANVRFFFGNPSDIPIAGDFNGDGCDTLSIYRPSEARFYIVNELGKNDGGLGAAEHSFLFGNIGDKPVVGDWDGDGVDEIGLHRESTGFFYFRNTLTTGNADGAFYFGDPGDKFIAGDWLSVDGIDTPAIYRPSDTTIYYRSALAPGNADAKTFWPSADGAWIPVAGTTD